MYDNEYIKFGFTYTGDQDCPKQRCIICGDVLENSSLKPSLLRQHLETRHPSQINKPVHFFKRKLIELKSDINNFIPTENNDNENALEESYRVSYRVAKAAKAHLIAESLISPCVKVVVQCLFGEDSAKKC
jgi:hypothetical protein